MSKEAMERALENIVVAKKICDRNSRLNRRTVYGNVLAEHFDVIFQALAEQTEQQEPSGHFLDFAYADSVAQAYVYDQFKKGQQFYAAPPTPSAQPKKQEWVGLTGEERDAIFELHHTSLEGWDHSGDEVMYDKHFGNAVTAIEAKLKEKNT